MRSSLFNVALCASLCGCTAAGRGLNVVRTPTLHYGVNSVDPYIHSLRVITVGGADGCDFGSASAGYCPPKPTDDPAVLYELTSAPPQFVVVASPPQLRGMVCSTVGPEPDFPTQCTQPFDISEGARQGVISHQKYEAVPNGARHILIRIEVWTGAKPSSSDLKSR